MVTKYGMSERLGNFVSTDDKEIFVGRDYGHVQNHSDAMQSAIDEEIARILDESYRETKQILVDNEALLEALAQRLLEIEKVESDEFEILYQEYAVDPKPLPGEATSKVALTPDDDEPLDPPDVDGDDR
jgi:cell division protease FtsH